ncbi:hypothetical protein JCM5353_007925 [Sporobolomyces roseus]
MAKSSKSRKRKHRSPSPSASESADEEIQVHRNGPPPMWYPPTPLQLCNTQLQVATHLNGGLLMENYSLNQRLSHAQGFVHNLEAQLKWSQGFIQQLGKEKLELQIAKEEFEEKLEEETKKRKSMEKETKKKKRIKVWLEVDGTNGEVSVKKA